MCTVLLSPGGYPIAVEYIISYIIYIPFQISLITDNLTLRLLMSYIYMGHLFLMFLDHTQRRSTVGRTPLDE